MAIIHNAVLEAQKDMDAKNLAQKAGLPYMAPDANKLLAERVDGIETRLASLESLVAKLAGAIAGTEERKAGGRRVSRADPDGDMSGAL